MSQTQLITIFALIVIVLVAGYLLYRRQKRNQAIANVLKGENLLGRWSFTAEEWKQAVEQEFDWAKASDGGGEVHISKGAIYIKSHSSDRLIYLTGDGKVVTHASYRDTEGAPLKIRVRWKIIKQSMDGVQQDTEYHKEDYRIPVPFREREAAMKVAEWFSTRIEQNMEAYTDLVAPDEPISLFGKDSF